jgi:CheY-like chemotaxis protein
MSIRILAVDDSPTMRGLIGAALTPNGFDVRFAEDGIDGLERLPEADPDLVITDINMPRLDGFGVIEGVRKRSDLRQPSGAGPHHRKRGRAEGPAAGRCDRLDREALR